MLALVTRTVHNVLGVMLRPVKRPLFPSAGAWPTMLPRGRSGLAVKPHELVRNEWEILGSRATTKQELQETISLIAQGRITPIVDRSFPFEEVEAAFAALQQGHSLGRNVLAI